VRTVTGPNGDVTSYGYDAHRHVTTEIDGYGSAVASTTMRYDAAGNLLSETTGQSVTASYAHPSTTSYGYDPVNRVNQQIDGYGTAAARRRAATAQMSPIPPRHASWAVTAGPKPSPGTAVPGPAAGVAGPAPG